MVLHFFTKQNFPLEGGVLLFWRVKMAAIDESERECRELLTDALINNQVHNTYTMDEFKELFPRKYR